MRTVKAVAPFHGVDRNAEQGGIDPRRAAEAVNCLLNLGTIRKRPGWTVKTNLSAVGAILGMFDYKKADPLAPQGIDNLQLVKAGTKLYVLDDFVATELDTSLSLSATELACFQLVNNKVYMADGVSFKVTDGTVGVGSVVDAQITRPTAVSGVASAVVGNLYGDYDYKITYYSTTWGQESPATAESAVVSPVNKQVDLTLPGASPDGRVNKTRIYRRKVSAYESAWSLVAEVDSGDVAYTDDIPDGRRDSLKIAPLSFADTLPGIRYLAWQNDVLFGAGCDTYPTRLYYTRAGYPWCMDSYLEIGGGHDTDRITGLSAFHGVLVVFKERSIWSVTGNSLDTFNSVKVKPGIGCCSHHSIVDIGNLLLFLGEDGFYYFDGADADRISGRDVADPIRPDMVARNFTRDRFVVGVYDATLNMVLWSYSTAGSASNDRVYALSLDNMRRTGFPSWCPWDYGEGLSYLTIFTDASTNQRSLALGFGDGYLGKTGGLTDDGASIEAYWRTGDLDAGLPDVKKVWGEFVFEVEPRGDPSPLTLNVYLDGSPTPTVLETFQQTRAIQRCRVNHATRTIALEWYQSSSTETQINAWMLEAFPGGHA